MMMPEPTFVKWDPADFRRDAPYRKPGKKPTQVAKRRAKNRQAKLSRKRNR